MPRVEDFRSEAENQWCPGCSNFGILTSLKNGCIQAGIEPGEICLVSGIGQAAKLPHYFRSNFFNGLHGRAIPVATGIHAVNPLLKTIVVTGEGDCYGEGGNHFIHAVRRNPDITLIVHNNQIYGLTKGQASPTTEIGERTRLQFEGVESEPLQPLAIALVNGCSFVARGFAGDIPHLSDLLAEAITFKGFSYVDVVQPCISWGTHPMEWYKERIFKLPAEYDTSNLDLALQKTREWKDQIPIGILYKNPDPHKLFGDSFRNRIYPGRLTELGFPKPEGINVMMERFKV